MEDGVSFDEAAHRAAVIGFQILVEQDSAATAAADRICERILDGMARDN